MKTLIDIGTVLTMYITLPVIALLLLFIFGKLSNMEVDGNG